MAKCDCYYQHGMKFLCYGTKEMEECSCNGDTSKCNFYPEKRNQKTRMMASEKRLIDASALLREIDGIHQRHYANSSYQFIHDFFLAMFRRIKKAPTVDAVEVVRCKDCKYEKTCSILWQSTEPKENGYCSLGERKGKDNG